MMMRNSESSVFEHEHQEDFEVQPVHSEDPELPEEEVPDSEDAEEVEVLCDQFDEPPALCLHVYWNQTHHQLT